jgi:hypothetical protein
MWPGTGPGKGGQFPGREPCDKRRGRMVPSSFREQLRAFQRIHAGDPPSGFLADLAWLENRDLDLSIRLGALLGFNALMVTVGTHPVSASPGAPLSLDAAKQLPLVIASLLAIAPFVWSSGLLLRALLIGEEFDPDGCPDADTLRQRMLAGFLRSIDVQTRFLRQAVRATALGGALTLACWAWIVAAKL